MPTLAYVSGLPARAACAAWAASSSTSFTGRSLRTRMARSTAPTMWTSRKSSLLYLIAAFASGVVINSPGPACNSRCPSAGACRTFCAAIAPPAPPRFSTMTGWPNCRPSGALRLRATTSDSPPAGNGTSSVTGRSG
ncbi:hypothetical protein D3C72_1375050 [compost metagenome]